MRTGAFHVVSERARKSAYNSLSPVKSSFKRSIITRALKELRLNIQTTDIGCKGNLLLDRMVGSHVIVVPPLQYKSGLKQMMEKMAEKLTVDMRH
ncbi:hypothetical protein ACROYT_G027854 [Oculina patagonica]